MKILVIGSRGMVGTSVVPALREDGHEIIEMDLISGEDASNASSVMEKLNTNPEWVINLAGYGKPMGIPDWQLLKANVTTTSTILWSMINAGVSRIINPCSTAYYGCNTPNWKPVSLPIKEDTREYDNLDKFDAYDLSKRMNMVLFRRYSAQLEIWVPRFAPVHPVLFGSPEEVHNNDWRGWGGFAHTPPAIVIDSIKAMIALEPSGPSLNVLHVMSPTPDPSIDIRNAAREYWGKKWTNKCIFDLVKMKKLLASTIQV